MMTKQTLLIKKVLAREYNDVEYLLITGSNIDEQNDLQLTPLIAAAAQGDFPMVALLLQFSPALNKTNRFGGTALLPASEKGYLRIVNALLDTGSDVNHQNDLGWSALMEAVILGDGGFLYQEIVHSLLRKGADSQLQDFENKSALDYAIETKNTAIYTLLTSKETVLDSHFSRRGEGDYYHESLDLDNITLRDYFYLGYECDGQGDKDKSLAYYEKGAKEDPQFYYYISQVYKQLGDIDNAKLALQKGMAQTETDFFAYHLSNLLRDTGNHVEALVIMKELLEKHPTRVDYLFHQSNSLITLNCLEEAKESMVQADKLMPQNTLFKRQVIQIEQMIEERKKD